MQETSVPLLDREDPLEEGLVTHSVLLPGTSHGQGSLVGHSPKGQQESDTANWLKQHTLYGTGTLLSALWWPKWERSSKERGYTYTYGWFTLLYSRINTTL